MTIMRDRDANIKQLLKQGVSQHKTEGLPKAHITIEDIIGLLLSLFNDRLKCKDVINSLLVSSKGFLSFGSKFTSLQML
jgi:hypothetical protein